MKSILIVDDEPCMAEMIKDSLASYDYHIDICHDGLKAMEYITAQRYHVIITDLILPEANGIALSRFIRNELSDEKRNTPIIAITGGSGQISQNGEMQDIISIADYVFKKPLQLDALGKKIETILAA